MPVTGRDLPSGIVTLLFTDIEGSTRLLQELGAERYADALLLHRERIRAAIAAHAGVEFGTEGDALFIAFERAGDALAAAEQIQAALAAGPIRVRIGIHSGELLIVDGDYVGLDVHKAARICSAADGGQILVSQFTRDLAGGSLLDLGEHRLKDLTAPERLFQLGDGEFPPARTLYRANLPVQPSPLIGRETELTELVELARTNRLVTLTGTGGTGKTRLALALAAELAEAYRDGVWWVPLAAVADPALVLPTVAHTLGTSANDLPAHLADRRLLLLLDNLEQVLGAAPAIGELLQAAPGLTIVATSRERLALSPEQEYPVPPLSEAGAAELFTARARQVKPDFEPEASLVEICQRLDRLPLALELAATRVKLMSQLQLLSRLERRLGVLTSGRRDLPERQATMRAAIDWSYELLTGREQRIFRALAIFRGSCELDAADAVCDAQLDDLQGLLDKSLLRSREDGRLFLLETTREYALDRLEEAEETSALRDRHAAWFVELVGAAEAGLGGAEQATWLERLRADNDNLRAVLAWAIDGHVASGAQLTATLSGPWRMSGQLSEIVAWYERALGEVARLPPLDRARALQTFGSALTFMDEYARAEQILRESLALFRAAGDEAGGARVLNQLGNVLSGTGSPAAAADLNDQALAVYERLGDLEGVAGTLHLFGENLRDSGELDRAAALLEQAAQINIDRADHYSAMTSLHSLGDLALDRIDAGAAATRYREALAICLDLHDDRSEAYCLAGLACVAALNGEAEKAGRLWAVAEETETRIGLRMLARERSRYERIIMRLEGDDAFGHGRAIGRSLQLEHAAREALTA